ncbi:4-hydroxy-tetrahydrodipicolinate reductase [Candidatus Aerophobetes bacterium Ae_b3a]|nr:MAG: 4-hydroxy-tetrahydrodipicolinate reductase [Candidatus Aerophobetes bacterium Ae_b3a]
MLRVIICGALGRMGKEIIYKISQREDIELVGAIESPQHPSLGKETEKGIKVGSHLENVVERDSIIIEFTTPPATLEHLRIAEKKGIPMVIGTTGFKEKEYQRIKRASNAIPIIISPNMSIGINLLYSIVKQITKILGENFDKEIIETHHRNKKDAPSGTAQKIAQIIAEVGDRSLSEVGVYGRKGTKNEVRSKKEIGIHSIRGGSVVGEHTVLFAGEEERLEITHRAESRGSFARGAILAAKFLVGKEKGLYDFQDVLGLR